MFTASPLVVCDQGKGFLDEARNEVRGSFYTYCRPTNVRPATAQEARAFFEHRMAIRRDLSAHYSKRGYQGD